MRLIVWKHFIYIVYIIVNSVVKGSIKKETNANTITNIYSINIVTSKGLG